MQIVTLTLNPAIDKNTSIPMVAPEVKLRCARPTYEAGGGGVNVSRAIRHLGCESLALWTKGGFAGGLLHEVLDGEGVLHDPIDVGDDTRVNLIVLEESSGQQFRFGMPGPRFTDADARRCLERVRTLDPAPEYLVLSGSMPPGLPDDFYAALAREAPASCRVVVDTTGPALEAALTGEVFLIKPNLREMGLLLGREPRGDAEVRDAARTLIDRCGVFAVVASIGAGGAIVVTSDVSEYIRSPTVPIRSKVGAGDSMTAGLVLSLARGRTMHEAACYGVAAGAAAVMTDGTQLCRREDAERLYQQIAP